MEIIMDLIKIVTINEDKKYNTLTIPFDENGRPIIYDSDIADCLTDGESDHEDTTGMTEVDLGDGSEYGSVYIDLPEDDPRFEEIESLIQGAGSYLHELDPELQDDYDGEND